MAVRPVPRIRSERPWPRPLARHCDLLFSSQAASFSQLALPCDFGLLAQLGGSGASLPALTGVYALFHICGPEGGTDSIREAKEDASDRDELEHDGGNTEASGLLVVLL